MRKLLTVYVDEADFGRLDAFADERGWTRSQVVRAAIRGLTRAPDDDPILELSGDIDGLAPDLSVRFRKYLNETIVGEPPLT